VGALLLLVALQLCSAQQLDPLDELARDGRWSELRDLAGERLQADSDDARAHYWTGRDLLRQGLQLIDGDRVARDLSRSFLDRAVQHLARLDVTGPHGDDVADWQLEAGWARTRGAWAQGGAVQLAEQLAQDCELRWQRTAQPMAAFVRGLLCEQREEAGALDWYLRAAAAAPERSSFSLQLALAQAGAGDESSSWDAFEQALAASDAWLDELLGVLGTLAPGRRDAAARLQRLDLMREREDWQADALLSWHRAHALLQLGQADAALAAFAAGSEGRTAKIDRAHASHLMAAGRPQDALELLLPLVAERDWASLDQALVAIGRLAALRRHPEALAACDALLAVEPRHELVLWNRALILWKAGQAAEAEQAFATLMQRSPGRSDVLNDAGLAAWGAGDMPRAQSLLEQAVALPGAIDAQENLALLLSALGSEQRARAASLLDAVLDQEPDRARALVARHDLRVGR